VIAAPFGRVSVSLERGAVVDVSFARAGTRRRVARTAPGRRASTALRQYLHDATRGRLPRAALAPAGTAFQKRVWRELMRIPPGAVRTYGELARRLGTSARAVGGACRANPIPILIPCHRVVAAGGEGGFLGRTRGSAMALKRWLLEHERRR
jgi:methylated-DNA-[protein]-cysteine S-methyltransferase